MELGGHAPVVVYDDADLDAAVTRMSASKFRNAGQICVAPTRFLVQEKLYAGFVDKFVAAAQAPSKSATGRILRRRWGRSRIRGAFQRWRA